MDNNVIKSFIPKNSLNPKVWDNPDNVEKAKIKPEIKKGLLDIAKEFIEFLDEDIFVEDIMLTGSLSNFNWSEFSDFDLHIIIDLEQFDDEGEVYLKLFSTKKTLFNDKHDLTIKGYDVEVYPQDEKEKHDAQGQYSLMNDEWLAKPKKEKIPINKSKLTLKINHWVSVIEKTLSDADDSSLKVSKTKIKKLTDKLTKFRKRGLEKDGEFSNENLVFKYLRRTGLLDKLYNYTYKKTTKELSIESDFI